MTSEILNVAPMINALLFLAVLAAVGDRPVHQLLIAAEGVAEVECRDAPAGWDPSRPHREASSSSVVDDFGRYFGGLSFQQTSILEAVWHGRVRFCTDKDEEKVLGALAAIVVHPPESPILYDSRLPYGAENLLRGLAGPALIEQLEATEPSTDEERSRQAQAIAVVEKAVASER